MARLPSLKWFEGRANYLEDQNKERDEMFDALDEYRHGEWDLDDELTEINWIHESRDPIFAQQSDSAKHILSDADPGISLLPYSPGGDGTDIADRHEKGLRWLPIHRQNQHLLCLRNTHRPQRNSARRHRQTY